MNKITQQYNHKLVNHKSLGYDPQTIEAISKGFARLCPVEPPVSPPIVLEVLDSIQYGIRAQGRFYVPSEAYLKYSNLEWYWDTVDPYGPTRDPIPLNTFLHSKVGYTKTLHKLYPSIMKYIEALFDASIENKEYLLKGASLSKLFNIYTIQFEPIPYGDSSKLWLKEVKQNESN
jgi:hypothetical protein